MEGINGFLWQIGWNPRIILAAALSTGIFCAILLSSPLGLLCGLPWLICWHYGVGEVHDNYRQLLDGAIERAKREGLAQIGAEASRVQVFVLNSTQGSRPLGISEDPVHEITFIFVGDTFLATFERCRFDLRSRVLKFAEVAREIYFRQIVGVDYINGEFEVRIITGERLRWRCCEGGSAALGAIRSGLRNLDQRQRA